MTSNFDVIGDVHGQFDKLVALLTHLGYHDTGGTWRHSSRSVIFLGDLIDRGPNQLATVDLVRPMVEAGARMAFVFRDAVKPSVGQTHAFDGWPWKDTLGLRGARRAKRNAAANFPRFRHPATRVSFAQKASDLPLSCAVHASLKPRVAILGNPRNACVTPWQIPFDVSVSPCFARPGKETSIRVWLYGTSAPYKIIALAARSRLPQEVATDGVRKASRARAPVTRVCLAVPGEYMEVRTGRPDGEHPQSADASGVGGASVCWSSGVVWPLLVYGKTRSDIATVRLP